MSIVDTFRRLLLREEADGVERGTAVIAASRADAMDRDEAERSLRERIPGKHPDYDTAVNRRRKVL